MCSAFDIILFWVPDSLCVTSTLWLHCHISQKSSTLANLFNLFFSSSVVRSQLFYVLDVFHAGSVLANIQL
jgi:hypothetical protein